MKRPLFALAAVAFALPAAADTFVLKGGKQVEGTILKDNGETYEVENDKGAKVTLKKSDLEKIIPVAKASEPPITGASFTFDKKKKLETIDLFAKVDPKKDGALGSWRAEKGALVGTIAEATYSKLIVPHAPPEEYDLTLTVERREGTNDFYVGLVGGGKPFGFHFDSYNAGWNGIVQVDGQGGPASQNGVTGIFFQKGKPRTITFMVRKHGLWLLADGKDYFLWKARWEGVSLDPRLAGPENKGQILVGTYASAFAITKIALTAPKN